jgi:hypothetical protein
MNQVPLQLESTTQADAHPAGAATSGVAEDAIQRDGFDIGWDHAHHGLVPAIELLLPGTPVSNGWLAARAVFGQRTLVSTRHTRQWLGLRLLAWRQGLHFEGQSLTPNYLAQIQGNTCPVTRRALHGAPGQPDTVVFERLNSDAGFAAGNLAAMSQEATQAWAGLSVADCVRLARWAQAAAASAPSAGQAGAPAREAAAGQAAQWWRLAALRAMATPLPFAEAAALPLAVLPPNRVRLLNAVQGLQALLTRGFASPGWSDRCRRFAAWLPDHGLRQDFNLFVGAMAPRVLDAAGVDAPTLRQALEDAWLQERVQRRWQQLVLAMGEPLVETLLERATKAGLAGVRTLHLATEQATDGWGLRNAPLGLAAPATTRPAQGTGHSHQAATPTPTPTPPAKGQGARATAERRPMHAALC